ncbi:hypothetical protein FGF80_07525 [Natrinema pallidum]|uniref:Uncharacterized protein n=1 Tax=Natrinema pallidum TaxID=69527 RepID=A0A4P9TE97_9EURY|nr:hypothetical protein FGF80_07525 [Natrinema pallidum]
MSIGHDPAVTVPETLVHVTLEPDGLGTGYDPAVGIVADAREAVSALEAIREALETALTADEPVLVEIPTDPSEPRRATG